MSNFCMPSLGADMDSGILREWKIKPGDMVKRGDIIAIVETLKGVIEIEIFENGIVDQIIVNPGTEVPVGNTLAIYRKNGEIVLTDQKNQSNTKNDLEEDSSEQPILPKEQNQATRIKISPAARHKALELGISLDGIKGTGPNGAIKIEDIEKYIAPDKTRSESLTNPMRLAIATVMSRSKREIPHYYLGHTINLNKTLLWLENYNSDKPVTERLVYTAILIKAVALALVKFKELNGYFKEGKFEQKENINVGIAISLRKGGLVAPSIQNVDQKNLFTLMKEFTDLVNRARNGQLKASEMSEGSITISNLGEQGVEFAFPIIYIPQVAMVGFGSVVERPWVVNGIVVPSKVITATLSGDHRVTDGHYGGRFLALIENLLQKPEEL